ncbi:hypothetical protein E8E11_003283 [Didymella keratinophila]|nr:hypothetical protein E8E11_003283 [Didymella keratinophila]
MALTLQPWLHQDVKDQLDLGHSWFDEKLKAKAKSAKPSTSIDKKWEGLYHDNGSCIDIVVPFCSEQAHVLVLKTSPLTITDGLHSTEASLTAVCLNDLRARYPDRLIAVGTTWTVKKYTIRYTSYGHPRRKLRIILDAIDCVDVCKGNLLPNAGALNRSNEIASSLQLIHSARVRDDDRCLRPQPREEEELDNGGCTMAGADERVDEDASINTQMPFGTQLQHPIRSRRSEDDVSYVGTNRLEPVLAGNTQRAELKPRSGDAADAQRKQAQLLSLLGKRKAQQPASPQSPVRPRPHHTPEPRKSGEHATTASPRPRETPGKQANRERIAELVAQASQPVQDKGKKSMREEIVSPSILSSKKTSFSEDQSKRSHVSEDKFAAGCSWMKGLTFNRATATVPEDQANLLNKSESWAKQSRFPPINIPIALFTIFSRTVDEKAALEGATSSGSFHETPSSGSCPDNSAPQPTEEQDSGSEEEAEEEAPTSPVTWHTSSSPRPPQRPTMPCQGLPPDSSVEMPEDIADIAKPQRPTVEQPLPSTLPASSHENEEELPPSSPPVQPAAIDSDDDMETSVPQALGEDLSQSSTHNHVPHTEIRSRSVVQVKETPYMKGKNEQQPVVTVCPPTQESISHSSSTSIVRGTYYPELSSSAVEETRLDGLRKHNDTGLPGENDADPRAGMQDAQAVPDIDAQDTAMFDMFTNEESLPQLIPTEASEKQACTPQAATKRAVQAQPEPTPMSAQLPPKDSSSGKQPLPATTQAAMPAPVQPERQPSRQPSNTPSLTKRKHAASPTLDRRRGSRVKRPKFAFGSKDPQTLIRERQESLQIERQKSTTSVESRQGSVSNAPVQQDPDARMEDLDTKQPVKSPVVEAPASPADGMSPRHRSLYASPSPRPRPVKAPPVADAAIESISLNQSQRGQHNTLADRTTDECPVSTQQEEPHEWPTSQAHFSRENSLKKQIKTHINERAHVCPTCDRRFSRTDALVQHQSVNACAGRQSSVNPTDLEQIAAKDTEVLLQAENVPEPHPDQPPESAPAPMLVSTSRPAPAPRPSPAPRRTSAEAVAGTKEAIAVVPADVEFARTVFEKFQAAYPEYKANSKHFVNQCKLIDELDREDRMVPKWMWDDFIIRNRTDYARYAMECVELGEEPMKYIRFYKDTIRDAIFKKGVIESRAALEKALQELGVQSSATKPPSPQSRVRHAPRESIERSSRPAAHHFSDARQARREPSHQSPRESTQPSPRLSTPRHVHSPMPPPPQPTITPPKKKASRKSLPFAVPSSASSLRANGTAHTRHSLPASSSRTVPTSTPAHPSSARLASSSQQKPRSSFSDSLRLYKAQPSASILTMGTGDEYRDFLNAHEAMTATTGSKRFDKSVPWPRSVDGRPSVRDLPKKKIDVLEWTDVL